MSKAKQIDMLYQTINNQNNTYAWTVGIFITIILTIIGFFAYFQWRLSESQIKKIKDETEKEIIAKYQLDNLMENQKLQLDKNSKLVSLISDRIVIADLLSNKGSLIDKLYTLEKLLKNLTEKNNKDIPNLINLYWTEMNRANSYDIEYIHILSLDINDYFNENWEQIYQSHPNYDAIQQFLNDNFRNKTNKKDD